MQSQNKEEVGKPMSIPRLYPTLILGADETPRSFASRLAMLHDCRNALTFCTDMGLRFNLIADGDETEIVKLAQLAGANDTDLLHNAVIREDGKKFHLRGESLMQSVLRREHTRVCPGCAADDIESTGLPPNVAVHGRVLWTIIPVRTCPLHNLAIVSLGGHEEEGAPEVQTIFDQSVCLGDLPEIHQRPSSFETYLTRRITDGPVRQGWVDQLEFHATVKTCEVIGAVALHGRDVVLDDLADADWRAAGEAGYEIAANGIREWLSELQGTFVPDEGGNFGWQAVFGQFYKWAAFSRNEAFGPVREILREHIIQTMPAGREDILFGRAVEKRIVHSIRTASLEYNAHPKRLRKILVFKGLVSEDQEGTQNNQVLFDAEEAQKLYEDGWFHALSLTDLETYLGAGRVQAKLLVESGIIKPVIGTQPGIKDFAFLKKDADAFLAKLTLYALPLDELGENHFDIPGAAKRANCSASEIVQLILDGGLDFVGQLKGKEKYLSIIVDVEEIKGKTRLPELDGLTAHDVEKDMRTSWPVVKALIDHGVLKLVKRINPINRCPVEVVLHSDYRNFREEYISHFELSMERKTHHITLTKQLAAKGIKPALDPGVFHARIYRRADTDRL